MTTQETVDRILGELRLLRGGTSNVDWHVNAATDTLQPDGSFRLGRIAEVRKALRTLDEVRDATASLRALLEQYLAHLEESP